MVQERSSAGSGRQGPSDSDLDRATPRRAGGREVRVGLFVLLGGIAFITVLFLMTDPATFRGRYMLLTEVGDAGGIRAGDPVQMRGVNVGRVHQFDLSDEGVLITLEIEGEWRMPSDSRAVLGSGDLLGGRTVNIVPGTSSTFAEAGRILPGSVEDGVIEMADTIGEEARRTMESVRTLLGDSTVAAVNESIEDLQALLASLSEITAEQRTELSALSESLNRSATSVEDLTGREELGRSIARADSTLAELRVASGSLARASSSFQTVMGRMERGEGTLGRLSVDEGAYDRLSELLEELGALARDLRENPGRYVNLSVF